MQKYGFVYIWYDRKRKMYYIGSHWGHENDGYICSSNRMRNVYKRRPEDFKRRIIIRIYTSRSDLLVYEGRWLSFIQKEELSKKYYNARNYQFAHWTTSQLLEIGKKISRKLKGNHPHPHKGKTWVEAYGEKRASSRKEKLSKAISGRELSEEHKARISEGVKKTGRVYKKGHKLTDEQKANMFGKAPWNKGKPATEEQKAKQSASMMGKPAWNKGLKMERICR